MFFKRGKIMFCKKKERSKNNTSIPDDSAIPSDRNCRECEHSKYSEGMHYLLDSGYVCHLNPQKPIPMGLYGMHSERKRKEEEQNL